jgi:hypothetical protein
MKGKQEARLRQRARLAAIRRWWILTGSLYSAAALDEDGTVNTTRRAPPRLQPPNTLDVGGWALARGL